LLRLLHKAIVIRWNDGKATTMRHDDTTKKKPPPSFSGNSMPLNVDIRGLGEGGE
jgi:hypothetical protein